jgi:hypothetical protein
MTDAHLSCCSNNILYALSSLEDLLPAQLIVAAGCRLCIFGMPALCAGCCVAYGSRTSLNSAVANCSAGVSDGCHLPRCAYCCHMAGTHAMKLTLLVHDAASQHRSCCCANVQVACGHGTSKVAHTTAEVVREHECCGGVDSSCSCTGGVHGLLYSHCVTGLLCFLLCFLLARIVWCGCWRFELSLL